MLSGSTYGSHPVRALFELGSFLNSGEVTLLRQTVRVIQGTQVVGEDLRAYIEGDSLHARMLSAMAPHDLAYKIGNVTVVRRTFALDLLRVAGEFGLEVPENLRGAVGSGQTDSVQQ
jgi:hypothetical protein